MGNARFDRHQSGHRAAARQQCPSIRAQAAVFREELMNRKRSTTVCGILVLIFAVLTPSRIHGQDTKNPYPNMASLDQYLMDRDPEIALARSAAPDSISRDAEVMVL